MMRPTRYMRPYILQPANFSTPVGGGALVVVVVVVVVDVSALFLSACGKLCTLLLRAGSNPSNSFNEFLYCSRSKKSSLVCWPTTNGCCVVRFTSKLVSMKGSVSNGERSRGFVVGAERCVVVDVGVAGVLVVLLTFVVLLSRLWLPAAAVGVLVV
ncbi:unnamed protein product [Ceratitis capitata]|uniref:(Mediterranean fruit fly) hypothetical protein n=1 Tax=Ceratitis capitata TaxID=7213 RepID=A0A811UIZ9_CERCA|nr:unnamed protein product [Ceratitis capitata]